MVCNRCIMVVRQELEKNGLHLTDIELGVARVSNDIDQETRVKIAKELDVMGFELLDGAKSKLVEQIKKLVIQKIHYSDFLEMTVNWSDLLSDELHHEYKYLSNLFSTVESMTLEHYIIRQKIEKVKELLFYDELILSEISYRLGYSSVQHLSLQFKKITGCTPSQYKKIVPMEKDRNALDTI